MKPTRTIAVSLLWPFQRAYAALGVPSEQLVAGLARFGLDPAELADPDARVALDEALRGAAMYGELLGRPDIGLLAGQAAIPGDFGTLELAARASATPGEALEVLASGYPVLAEGVHLALERREPHLTLRLLTEPDVRLPPAAVEFALLSLVRIGLSYVEASVTVEAVRFAHPEVAYAGACRKAFGCPVHFDRAEHALDLPLSKLDTRLPTASPVTATVLRSRVGELVSAVRDESVVAQVDAFVSGRLAAGLPTVAETARALGTSERSLHRKLEDAGTTYRGVCDEVRRRLAEHYLGSTPKPIKQIATALAFGDVHAFHRAFKRLTGKTPQQYRRERRSR